MQFHSTKPSDKRHTAKQFLPLVVEDPHPRYSWSIVAKILFSEPVMEKKDHHYLLKPQKPTHSSYLGWLFAENRQTGHPPRKPHRILRTAAALTQREGLITLKAADSSSCVWLTECAVG
ncbi:hypothetical protein CEXT_672701 [Caerostris extrusa]|uniref:Uncharacterized protein n=1 Tax=Caerostris extrusa TaxID=172846 RepID=A0AAV4QRW0_CAEEX|nr:hypothetical protein CEXT_672701 [Caerostris extrusa]